MQKGSAPIKAKNSKILYRDLKTKTLLKGSKPKPKSRNSKSELLDWNTQAKTPDPWRDLGCLNCLYYSCKLGMVKGI